MGKDGDDEGASASRSAFRAPRLDDPTAAFTPSPEIPSSPSPLFPSSPPPPPTVPIAGLSTSGGGTGRAFFRAVAELGIAAAEALHHAHEHGIVHRDVKPANLMVDHRGKLWVTDFGLAQMESAASLTTPGDLLGTLRYMSPEQALAKRVAIDYRTDIYSLGATLYEMSTLEPVFATPDKQELLRQLAFEEPRSLRKVRRNVPGEIETIVLKALEKNPADRYQSAQELADDLRRYLDEKPIRARRPGIRLRSVKWARRHRGLVSAAGAIVLVAVVALGVSNYRINAALGTAREAAALEKEARLAANNAAQAEKRAKETAQAREAETAAVLDFVESKVFAAGRPEEEDGGLGRDVRLIEAVEAAMPFVGKNFSTQPLIEAKLRLTLGKTFWDLGHPEKAEEQFQKARTLYTKHLGLDHPKTLASTHNLANSYAALGRHAEALKLHKETLVLMKDKLGADHPDTLESMNSLANSYDALGRHAEALKLHEETLTLKKAHLGPEHPDTLGGIVNLAIGYNRLGRHADAVGLYEAALPLMKHKMPDHRFTSNCMNNLANCYELLGRNAEALKLREETLALWKAKLGPEHPNTLSSMMGLANSYHTHGQHAQALKLNEESLALRKAKLGPDHPETLASTHNLANSYAALGRHAEALKLREETLALWKAKLGAEHPDTLWSMWGLAESLVNADRGSEALPIADECLRLAAGKVVNPGLVPGLMGMRLRHFAKCGDAAGCRATAEMWEDLKRADAGSLYNAACFRAVTAAVIRAGDQSEAAANDAAAEADRAMEWLKQAIAAGFKDAAHMKHDTDLEALRAREDFKQLIAELEAGGM